jgi:hypothetical protein
VNIKLNRYVRRSFTHEYNVLCDESGMSEKMTSSILTGIAGEYFVAGELSRRGYIASITLRNTKGVDILCSSSDTIKTAAIQVKTNRGSTRKWMLTKKAEDNFADNLFYVFVTLNNNQKSPNYFIVPSDIVAEYVKTSHSTWLNTPGKNGKKHNDSSVRNFHDYEEEYLDRWDILKNHLEEIPNRQ